MMPGKGCEGRRKGRRVLAAAILFGGQALAFGGCADTDEVNSSIDIDSIRGMVVVRNPAEGLWTSREQWSIQEDLRIGSVDGASEELFGGVLHAVALGPTGAIYVLDVQARDLRAFDAQGNFLARFGGAGRGPGELSQPNGIGFDPIGRLWVSQPNRYTLFQRDGEFIETRLRPLRAYPRPLHRLHFESDLDVIDEAGTAEALLPVRVDSSGLGADTLPGIPHPRLPPEILSARIPRGSDYRTAVINLLPRLVWTVGPDQTIWFARSDELRLYQRSLEGDTIRVIETSHREEGMTRRQASTVRRGLQEMGLDPGLEEAFVRPIVRNIFVTDDHYVLVQIADPEPEDERQLDVFDPQGRFLGTVVAPFALTRRGIPDIRGDTIVGTTLGRYDVAYVVRGIIDRPRHGRSQ